MTVSILKEQHITYKLNNILITAQKAKNCINKVCLSKKSRILNTQNNLTLKKRKKKMA